MESMNIDFIKVLGAYYGEPAVANLLEHLSISGAPKLKRGDDTAFLKNHALGIELTFTEGSEVDHPPREYPEGALVLDNIRFYGDGANSKFTRYGGVLPLGLAFGMSYEEAVNVLGHDDDDDPDKSLVRWDLDGYCVFGDFSEDRLIIVSLQLPVIL